MTLEVNTDFRWLAIGFLEVLIDLDPQASKLDKVILRRAKERIAEIQHRSDYPDQALTL